jgi:YqaJ-like viral recombinase domain
MAVQIHDVEQNSTEWLKLRCGLVTASNFATVMASGKGCGESITRRKYMLRLAGEIITGDPEETYNNAHMERGKAMEDEARNLYAFMHDVEPIRVGFIVNGRKGCSPDSLVGDRRMLEIKTALPSILIEKLIKDDFPPEHKAQCQGGLWVAEREEIDIAVYWPKMPLFVKTARRDETYIRTISRAVDDFNAELAETVDQIRRYAGAPSITAEETPPATDLETRLLAQIADLTDMKSCLKWAQDTMAKQQSLPDDARARIGVAFTRRQDALRPKAKSNA